MNGPVAVSGIGVVAPNGLGTEQYWTATVNGRGGLRPVSRFDASDYPARVAGEVTDLPVELLPGRLLPQTDPMTRMALIAADWALSDADLDCASTPEYGVGVVTASSCGGFEFGQRELGNLWREGPRHVSAYQSFAWFYAVNSGQISIRHGLRGPAGVLVADGAGGLDAFAQARRLVRRGTPAVLAGAADSRLCPWAWVAEQASGQLSPASDPCRAYLPFDAAADGNVAGEGGAILVLEDADSLARRRAPYCYGLIAGHAAAFDPGTRVGAEPGLLRAASAALADAGVSAADVDAVFADGAAIHDLDRAEADTIAALFGPRGVPVTVPRTMTGRLGAAGAPLDVAAALLSIRDNIIPPTINVTVDDNYKLDLVTGEAREVPVHTALILARGHGGFNSALVVTGP